MTSAFTIRTATVEDAPAVLRAMVESFEELRGKLDPPSGVFAETEESISAKLAQSTCYIAVADGACIGCVFCKSASDHLYLSRLGVIPRFRSQGCARALIRAVEERALSLGLDKVRLSTRTNLTKNISYYESLGYTHYAREPHPDGGGPGVMHFEKELRSASVSPTIPM